jgi:hypothetical protein
MVMDDKPTSQNEAKLAAEFLKKNKNVVRGGYVSLWRMRPSDIAKAYKIPLQNLLSAIRREAQ